MGKIKESDDLPEALKLQDSALRIYERLAYKDFSDARLKASLQASFAECCSSMAVCFSLDHQPEKCLEYLDKAREIQLGLVDGFPGVIEYKRGLAEIMNRKGFFYFERGDFTTACQSLQRIPGPLSENPQRASQPHTSETAELAGDELLQYLRDVPSGRQDPACR